jgi:hypothetical protein
MLRRLERLRQLRQHKKANILYDEAIEGLSLERTNGHFLALINSLPADYRQRWFLATKNHVDLCKDHPLDVDATDLPERERTISGAVPHAMLSKDSTWLSFNGSGVFDGGQIEITCQAEQPLTVDNCYDELSLTRSWPVYEPSPKHRLEEYQRNGVRVSPMDLSIEDAQAALLVAEERGDDRFALVRGKFYRFVLTNTGAVAATYHGFRIESGELAPDVLQVLLQR